MNYELYIINQKLRGVMNSAAENDGELTDENLAELENLESDKNQILLDLGCVVIENERLSEIIGSEIERLRAKISKLEITNEKIRDYLLKNGVSKLKDHRVSISTRKSSYVNILDLSKIPQDLLRIKTEPNKTEIKKRLEAGSEVTGAEIVPNISIVIK